MAATGLILPFDRSVFGVEERDLLLAVKPHIDVIKIGLEAWTAIDPDTTMSVGHMVHRFCKNRGVQAFEDWKLHDIPNTVEGAARNIAKRAPAMLTMHASAGAEAITAVKRACAPMTKLLVVTVLTSLDDPTCRSIFGADVAHKVVELAKLGAENGADGIVCSPKELRYLKDAGSTLLTVIPGIRPAQAAIGDQKRVMTPREAALEGADYVVCGRPITEAEDPAQAAADIKSELRAA